MKAHIAVPPSKSVANRALVLADLAGRLSGVAWDGGADDTRILRQLLRDKPFRLHCGEGGTTFRFLLAWACVQEGAGHLVTGHARLLQRPHEALVEALRTLGADITVQADGLLVRGRRMRGGTVRLHSPASSQYISALLLIAARFAEGMELHWTGTRLSRPYVDMTMRLCRRYGAAISEDGDVIRVAPGPLQAVPTAVPGDWSAAAFWYQIAALSPGSEIHLAGLEADGLQGDEAVASLLAGNVQGARAGNGLLLRHSPTAEGAFAADLTGTPDLFQPLAFTMAGLGRPAAFTGLDNLPLKETDRIQAVGDALRLLGVRCHAGHAGTFSIAGRIVQPKPLPMPVHGDHRMAMGLAPLALVTGAMVVRDPQVVAKSYPAFWQHLAAAGFRQQDAG